jgi:DNA polymerase III delta subunit
MEGLQAICFDNDVQVRILKGLRTRFLQVQKVKRLEKRGQEMQEQCDASRFGN